ncbi:superoxide dismutase family protein [Myxococcus xanthus]|uniref:Superoxide dismutase [Cu-Zn] n=1 Tax=Myxococcus xanthus TaxID=34 RepID=A0AAE6G4Z5_MYXXA|nr:superoxide dismutase family protein [Myxococcus xanthus]QDE70741.1 superoxide dismutase [Myxococcus xanthus]QDE78020.1 superoxide dismutase [Myxococcus xanthus]QDE85406.1 superoxide dismutase [Myxococcus xanthus]QDE99563.1 superoxide dismutase [Myxococcus xanthus]QDF07283.1 superoxide dismutase [Myxococcus xanthus]
MKIRALLTAAALTAALPALAQENAGTPPPADKKTQPKGQTAKAQVKDSEGKDVGEITLEQTQQGVLIKGKLSNLPPGQHAFHIHEVGKCEGPAFTTAGGHFNPSKKAHGLLAPKGKHQGDLPNLYVASDGTVQFDIFSQNGLTLKSLFDKDGSAVVVHAKEDDYHTDPTGDAGGRIACGVVEKS